MYAVDVTAPRRPTVAPLRNPGAMAPSPYPMPASIAAGRAPAPVASGQVMANPGVQAAATVAPAPQAPVSSMAPIAYAMSQYQEPGDPFTAAAEGFVHAQQAREQQVADQTKATEAAKLIGDHPDLKRAVETGVLSADSALTLAQKRDELKASSDASSQERAQILYYLRQAGDDEIAAQFESGILDKAGVSAAVAKKDGGAGADFTLGQNEKRFDANGNEIASNVPADVVSDPFAPAVGLTDKGIPDPVQQDAFLQTLDPATAALVKGIAGYQMDISKVTSLRGDQRQKLAQLVTQYDPTFDMTQYGARAAMRKSITSGTYSQALNSANLVIQHLDALSKSVDDLHNSGFQPWNSAANATKNAFGDPAITRFNTAADAAAAELAKVFKGTGASSEEEIKTWRRNLDINGSPEQIKTAINTAIGDLLKSRIDTIQNQFNSAMGHPLNFSYLTPHSRQVLSDMGIDPSALDPAIASEPGGPPASQADADAAETPAAPKTQQEYDALPSGALFVDPDDGQTYRKP